LRARHPARNQRHGLQVASVNAWAMLYGAGIVSLVALVQGIPFAFETSPVYVGSLLYLAIPGSVIGFTTYLTVVHRLGPERAASMTVLFPWEGCLFRLSPWDVEQPGGAIVREQARCRGARTGGPSRPTA
jgi:drug/metabolite transporter (DMT)-like permease